MASRNDVAFNNVNAFADDLVIFTENRRNMELLLETLVKYTAQFGLKFN